MQGHFLSISPTPFVEALCIGQPKALTGMALPTAIAKQPMTGPVAITKLGLAGDQQGNPKVHGGPDKALHHYPLDHYAHWRDVTGLSLEHPGAFGENISTIGLTERTVCLGDIYAMGTARIQISHGRQPCRTLAAKFRHASMVVDVLATGYTGWYYRVLQEGEAQAGQPLTLLERPCPDWSVHRLTACLLGKGDRVEEWNYLSTHPLLAQAWRDIAEKKLNSIKA